ncbi:hypothetical protein PGB90_001781 [Kerria lacca]
MDVARVGDVRALNEAKNVKTLSGNAYCEPFSFPNDKSRVCVLRYYLQITQGKKNVCNEVW